MAWGEGDSGCTGTRAEAAAAGAEGAGSTEHGTHSQAAGLQDGRAGGQGARAAVHWAERGHAEGEGHRHARAHLPPPSPLHAVGFSEQGPAAGTSKGWTTGASSASCPVERGAGTTAGRAGDSEPGFSLFRDPGGCRFESTPPPRATSGDRAAADQGHNGAGEGPRPWCPERHAELKEGHAGGVRKGNWAHAVWLKGDAVRAAASRAYHEAPAPSPGEGTGIGCTKV